MCRLVNSAQTTLAGGVRLPYRPSPSLPVNSHSIAFPHSLAILNRIVALGSLTRRLMGFKGPGTSLASLISGSSLSS